MGRMLEGARMASDHWLRRLAVQVVAQLPANPDEASQVLRYAQDVVDNFMRLGSPPGPHQVLPFSEPVGRAPSDFASSTGSQEPSPNQSQSVVKPGTR